MSLAFVNLPYADLDAFTENIIKCMTGNANFATPVPPMTVVTPLLGTFTSALAAAATGGKADTAIKNNARAELLGVLREVASYVQGNCHDDLAILLSSGFQAISTNRAQSTLPKPAILSITNDASTKLTLHVQPVSNAKAYEVRYMTSTKDWQSGGVFTQARKMIVEDLTPGVVYTFQVRAIGGSSGYSDWSDPLSHMCT